MKTVSPESPLPYFAWMLVYVLLAGVVARSSRFFARQRAAQSREYNVPLEGLRGILALSVFFHHAMITYFYFRTGTVETPLSRFYTHCGRSAVLMFFFLTGFLFWTKVLRSGAPEPVPFLRARLRRLAPAYALSLALVLLVTAARSGFLWREGVPAVVAEVARWCGFGFLGFPDVNRVPMTRLANYGVFWTLQWEWVFYLALPFLGWFAHRGRLVILAGMLALVHVACIVCGHSGGIARLLLTGFVPGMAVAHVARARFATIARASRWSSVVALAALAGAVSLRPDSAPAVLLFSVAFAVIASGADVFGLLRRPALVLLGQISYSIYVLHGVVLFTVIRAVDRFAPVARMGSVPFWVASGSIGALAILVSAASYRFVEYPFLRVTTGARPRPGGGLSPMEPHGVAR